MSIAADSRYATGVFHNVVLPDGTGSLMLWPPDINLSGVQFVNYTVVQGDRLDYIANRMYHDPTKWWVIADINPGILFPLDIIPGQVIRLPIPGTLSTQPMPDVSGVG